MTSRQDHGLLVLLMCLLVGLVTILLSGCAFITAIAPGLMRALIIHGITTKGERPVKNTIDLCYRCGLPEDECRCDEFIRDDDDEDQYTEGLPTAEDLMSEDYQPPAHLTEAEDNQRDAESEYPY